MAYKLLGMAVWKAAKLYLRRRVNTRKLAVGAGLVVVGGIAAAAYLSSDSDE